MMRMRLAMCVAVFALVGGIAFAEDMDIRSLQAKLAAQEARLNDLQAKMNTSSNSGAPEGIVSMRKNAVVTVGGTVNTRYFVRSAKVDSSLDGATVAGAQYNPAGVTKKADTTRGDLRVSDAKLNVQIAVNDNVDAYLQVDLQDTGRDNVSALAQAYWIRWKNICNSGFGVLVGRSNLVFGGVEPVGLIESFGKAAGTGDTYAGLDAFNTLGINNTHGTAGMAAGTGGVNGNGVVNVGTAAGTNPVVTQTDRYAIAGEGMFNLNGFTPTRPMWDYSRTTQITPYWESQDGKYKAELSFMQSIDTINGGTRAFSYSEGGVRHDRSINYGLGTMSLRLTAQPIEGLKVVASVLNMRSNDDYGRTTFGAGGANQGGNVQFALNPRQSFAKNNIATHLGVQYNPTFFNKLTVWSEWIHGFNNSWVKNLDSDTLTFGAMLKLTDKLTAFGRYEYMVVDNSDAVVWNKANGWASYVGGTYALGYGVNLEAGWRHERIDYKNNAGVKHTKLTTDTVYGHLGFAF